MGKLRKNPAAQRKFAQGMLIPTHCKSASAPVKAASRVCLKPVKTSCPVILIGCSPKDLLTRMSLGKAACYQNLQPLPLKYLDSKNTTPKPETPQKNRLRTNRRTKISDRKHYFLRKRKPIKIDIISAFIEYLL